MKIAVYQLCSQLDFKPNLEKINRAAAEASQAGAVALFLPECFYSMSDGSKPTPYLVEKNNEHFENIRSIARENKIYLLGGSVAYFEQIVINRVLNFDDKGNELPHYDKMHLFSCDIIRDGKRKKIDEADIYTPGNKPQLLNIESWKIGLGVCFDLRYSEMAKRYHDEGAKILTFSSAFTVPTGKAHWHTLLRARAIESQCYVIAPAQWGRHNDKIQTYGHSLIVDPWGEVLADAGEGESLIYAELEAERIDQVRSMVKM
jgi:predicted amidohydrolase